MTFMTPGVIAEDKPIQINAHVQRIGKNLCFSRAEIIDTCTSQTICEGTHVKAIVDKTYTLL